MLLTNKQANGTKNITSLAEVTYGIPVSLRGLCVLANIGMLTRLDGERSKHIIAS